MKHWLETNFPIWFVFGGYSDPGFAHTRLYDPKAPCDVATSQGDVWTSIPYHAAEKLVAARDAYVAEIEKIAEEYPEIVGRLNSGEVLVAQVHQAKQASREQDAADLASGKKTREQLWKENTLLRAANSTIDISKIPVPEDDESRFEEAKTKVCDEHADLLRKL